MDNYAGGGAVNLGGFFSGITNTVAREQQRLANQQAQEAKRLQSEQDKLTDIVKKVNVNGVQKQHLPEITAKLESIYDTYYKANQAEKQSDRLAYRLELEKNIAELGADVAMSKQYGQQFLKVADQIALKPQLFSGDARKQFELNFNKPLSQLNGTEANLQMYISPDTSILDKTEDIITKSLWSRANEKTTYGKTIGVGQTGDRVTQTFKTKSINQDDLGAEIFKTYNDNSGYRNIIDYQASQVGMTPQEYLLERTKTISQINKPIVEEGQFRNSRPRAPKSSSSDSVNSGFTVENNFDINYGSRTAGKTATVTAREYVAIPTSPTISAGKFSMQDTDGNQYDSKNTTEELKLVSVGTFPVLKSNVQTKSAGTLKAGAMATKSYAEKNPDKVEYVPKAVVNVKRKRQSGDGDITTTYFADPKEVIARTKLTKAQKTALDAYTQTARSKSTAPRTATTTSTTPKKKTISGF